MQVELLFQALALLLAVNGAPILARKLGGDCCAWSIDGGATAADGRPWLGPAKTWRGLLSALFAGVLVAWWLGLPAWQGGLFAALAMLGDLGSSFIKRRLAVAPSDSVLLLDQLPEALLPLVVFRWWWPIGWGEVALGAALFAILELAISPLLFRLHVRRRPR